VFEVCSAPPPVDLPFRPLCFPQRRPIHRCGTRSSAFPCDRGPPMPSRVPVTHGVWARTARLEPPGGRNCVASPTLPPQPPHPAPRLETLDQTPLGNGAGQPGYKSTAIGMSTILYKRFFAALRQLARVISGGCREGLLSSRASGARPGTHTPCPVETARRMGPRLRGDDELRVTAPSRPASRAPQDDGRGLLSSRASAARPGTHTPCPIETARRMGPRFRGDDTLWVTDPSRPARAARAPQGDGRGCCRPGRLSASEGGPGPIRRALSRRHGVWVPNASRL